MTRQTTVMTGRGSAMDWYQYPITQSYGEGDISIGGEHGTDFGTPLFTPITALLSGTVTAIRTGSFGYGDTITWQLDTPYNGATHAYTIHLSAINPNVSIGTHVNVGDVIGYSGGATPDSYQQNLASTPYSLPSGLQAQLDTSQYSTGAHTEFGFTNANDYDSGDFSANSTANHPELNPTSFINSVRAGVNPIQSAQNAVSGAGDVIANIAGSAIDITNIIGNSMSSAAQDAMVKLLSTVLNPIFQPINDMFTTLGGLINFVSDPMRVLKLIAGIVLVSIAFLVLFAGDKVKNAINLTRNV